MNKNFHIGAPALLLLLMLSGTTLAQGLSSARDGQRPPDASPQTQQYAGPIKLFDNLYYVGTTYVSAYLLVTRDGLILLDALYNEFTAQALDAIRELGFDPADIRYVLVSHGHNDHAGGVDEVKAASGAMIGMSDADRILSGREVDWVINDGDSLTLGDTTILFFLTPGHTPGVLSMLFPVRDGGNEYQAFLFGGHNVTSDKAEDFEMFIDSVERVQSLLPGVDVNLTSHPWAALIFQRAGLLAQRAPGDAHPFVDGEDFIAFLDERLENARQRLAIARQGR